MRKLFKNTIILTASLLISSCSDFLSETPKDQITKDEAYNTPELIYANAVANLYTLIGAEGGYRGLAGTDRSIYDITQLASDEFILPRRGGDWEDGGLWTDLFKLQWGTDNSIIRDSWNYLYEVVGKCNASIDLLTELSEKSPNNTDYPLYITELRAFRAMYYFYILDMYGRIPLVISSKVKMADIEQSERKTVYEFIVKELQETVEQLNSVKSNLSGPYYGRITQGVGYFLLAKLALNAEVYNDNNWMDNNGIPNGESTIKKNGVEINAWDAVIEYCAKIKTLGYDLEEDFAKNFKVANEDSKENIFVIPMDPTLYKSRMMYVIRSLNYSHGKAYGYDAWNGASLTYEAFMTFKKNKEEYNDTRLDKSFFYGKALGPDGEVIKDDNGKDVEYAAEKVKADLSNDPFEKTGGARWAKYELDKGSTAKGQLQHNDYVMYRYADVLLMAAEAKIRKAGGTLASQPDELKQVRDRSLSTKTSATLDDILDERLLELSWEGFRRNDLIRFGKFTKPLRDRSNVPVHTIIFPIPEDVIKTMEKRYKQNPGY